MIYPAPAINNKPNYNAVRIQINDPKTRISPDNKPNANDNGIYNGVDIQVNRPSVEPYKPFYEYPQHAGIVPFPMAVPGAKLPLAYQTNLITNRTYIHNNNDYEIEFELEEPEKPEEAEEARIITEPEEEAVEPEVSAAPQVPEANYTTLEAEKEKLDLNAGKLSFHAQRPEIIPGEEILPDVDIHKVVGNLNNPNFDIQASQMEEIVRSSMTNPKDALPYVVKDVFSSLINIVRKDTSDLAAPSQQQIEIRLQIIVNEVVKEYAKNSNQDPQKVELPYKISAEDAKTAAELTPKELAERNKEYALYAMAVLAKIYTDNIEKETGTVVPLTDLPGVSTVVDTLRYNENPEIKTAAIDALLFIQRPEYKEELNSLLTLVGKDDNPGVAAAAQEALIILNRTK